MHVSGKRALLLASALAAAATFACANPEKKPDVRRDQVFQLLMEKKPAPDTLNALQDLGRPAEAAKKKDTPGMLLNPGDPLKKPDSTR